MKEVVLALASGLLVELAIGLIILGMLIKTIKIMERIQRAHGKRIVRLDRRLTGHIMSRTEHPDRNAIEAIAREVVDP